MKLSGQIEHLERFSYYSQNEEPWKNRSKSRKDMKIQQHRAWRRWSKKYRTDENGKPMYSRYSGWEY